MNKNEKLFLEYIEHHKPKYRGKSSSGAYKFCGGHECSECIIDITCNNLGEIPTVTSTEINNVKELNPEYFV